MSIPRLAALAALSSLLPPPAQAGICFQDDVPAATLLLPYFEVDLDDPNGKTTLMSVNNASADGIVAHVVLWTDLSVPTFDFDVYLTGYDVQSIDLRDLFTGTVPSTASAGQDPWDVISPRGAFSRDADFPSCNGLLPRPALPASFLAHLRAWHTGHASPVLGTCAGRDLGDNVARGYVTVDVVNHCTLSFPSDAGYFVTGGGGVAAIRNVLWGDYFYLDLSRRRADGETLVHIEAADVPETTTPGNYTFYGRYVGWTAADNREPLATRFAIRYLLGGRLAGTDLLVWRDSKVVQRAFTCGLSPAWYPLDQKQVVIFDERESPEVLTVPPYPFPAEAQRTMVGGPDLSVTASSGWLDLNLNATVAAAGPNPPVDPEAAQAWVATEIGSACLYSVGFDAIRLESACR